MNEYAARYAVARHYPGLVDVDEWAVGLFAADSVYRYGMVVCVTLYFACL